VIDPGIGEIALTLDFCPSKWRFGDVEDPAVVDALISNIPSKDN
jgi:hypothetical protein